MSSCGLSVSLLDVIHGTMSNGLLGKILVHNATLRAFPALRLTIVSRMFLHDDLGGFTFLGKSSDRSRRVMLWVPFCRKHNIEPRNPDSYFTQKTDPTKNKKNPDFVKDHRWMKREYDEFKVRINGLPDVIKKRCEKYNNREEMKEKNKSDSSASSESGQVPKATWMADGTHWPGTWLNPSADHKKGDHAGIIQNDHFFWVDAFACPTFFPWNASTTVSKDPFPKSSQYNAEHYATLVAYPAPFHNNLFLFFENLDILAFIRTADPTKVRIGERQRGEDEPKLLDTTVGRTVPLLPVAPARAQSELDASVDWLFDEEGSGNEEEPHDSADVDQSAGTLIVSEAAEVVGEDVIPLRPRQKKQKTNIDAGEPSHPAKKLRDDYGAPGGPSVADKSRSAVQRLLAGEVLNAEVMAGRTDPGGFSDVSGSDFLVGGIRTVVDPEFDLQKVYVPQWSVTNGSCLDDGRVCCEMLDEFAPPNFFASIRGMEHDQLFTEFNVGTARQISLSAKVRMRAEYNIKEKRRLKTVVEEKDMLLKTKGEEIDSLSARLHLKEAEAAEAIHLRAEASRFVVVEKSLRDEVKFLRERNAALEEENGILNVKVTDLAATVKVREQEAADSDALVTAVKLQNDSLVDQVHALEASSAGLQEKVTAYEKFVDQLEKFQDDKIKEVNDKLEKLDAHVVAMLAIAKCLNSTKYLSALGAAIGKAIEKGMQEGLSAGITHGIEGRTLTDIAAYNPSAEADYLAALHHLQSIKENLANRVSALCNVFIPLSEPLSVTALTGTESTSAVVAAPAGTTTALSVTFASASVVRPISTDDYEVVQVDGHGGGGTEDQIGGNNVDPFPSVDDADLNLQ
ncbi:gypsy type transposase [Tanacetum coccineum]